MERSKGLEAPGQGPTMGLMDGHGKWQTSRGDQLNSIQESCVFVRKTPDQVRELPVVARDTSNLCPGVRAPREGGRGRPPAHPRCHFTWGTGEHGGPLLGSREEGRVLSKSRLRVGFLLGQEEPSAGVCTDSLRWKNT